MNQESFEFTKDQLKNLGFGEDIAKDLHTKMDQNLAEFTLNHSRAFGKDVVDSVLHFSKGDQLEKDITFFNRFDSTLKKEGMEDLTQTFFVGAKYNYTLQERYNMMEGRAAFREQPKMERVEVNGEMKMMPTGETYFAWRALDFKSADKFGNFDPKVMFWDHEKELKQYPVKGVEEKYDLSRLLPSIQRGNLANVTIIKDGQEIAAKVVANPRMMRLDFYDAAGQKMELKKVDKQAVNQTQKVELTPQQVQQAAIARGEAAKQTDLKAGGVDQAQGQQAAQSETNSQSKTEQVKQQDTVAAEQKNDHGHRRKTGVKV
ncbi:hypothetical protein [Mucilaginibacter sp. UYCu711]|uniref:hypothetical protein n=1 Tax=Mucilaginibacter sp. UYCu711 TaxID=3156339 RepID=UPI003D23F172